MFRPQRKKPRSYDEAVEERIIDILSTDNDKVTHETIYSLMGKHEGVTSKVQELEYKDVLRRDGERGNIRLAIKTPPSVWHRFREIPCVSCPKVARCEKGNPVNPMDCVPLNAWLSSY